MLTVKKNLLWQNWDISLYAELRWFTDSCLSTNFKVTLLKASSGQGRRCIDEITKMNIECFTLVEIWTLLETCIKRGALLGMNLFISHDQPPRNPCLGLLYSACEFLDKICSFKDSRHDFLRSISGRVHISSSVKDSILILAISPMHRWLLFL